MKSKIEKMIDMVEEFYRQIRDTEYLYKGIWIYLVLRYNVL